MIWVSTSEKFAVVYLDIFDATALGEGKVDSVTKELAQAVKKKLEEKERERRSK